MEEKVDVAIATYGKPWNLLVTLESLMTHCEQHIDKIYLLEEAKHPYGDNIDVIFEYDYPIIHHKYKKWWDIYHTPSYLIPKEGVRHQYAIENSDKKYLFISHNDVLYTGNVIGGMLDLMEENVAGIGEIGQCWNCPFSKMCGKGQNWNNWNPTYEDLLSIKLPHIRTRVEGLSKEYPKLVPECRLNEWSALINRELCIKHPTPYFGSFDEDSGTQWFKAMHKREYKFIDYRKDFRHGYFSEDGSGYNDQQVEKRYRKSEELAKQYFKEHYEIN